MTSPREEAEIISEVLFEEYGSIGVIPPCLPPIQEGKEAVLWLKDNNFPFGEVRWAGFFIKHYTLNLLEKNVPSKFERFNPHHKRYLIRGKFFWDIRMKSTSSNSSRVILWDKKLMDDFFDKYGGVGVLVVVCYTEEDLDHSFLEWHEDLKGGKSKYTEEREQRGAPVRTRKKDFMIVYITAFYFTRELLEEGLEAGWVDPSFQTDMRNFDGKPRNPKYIVDISRVPQNKGYLFTTNFNYDPDDFAEDFPEEDYDPDSIIKYP